MENKYKAEPAVINKIIKECCDVKTYNISLKKSVDFEPGQFFMLGVPGFGEAPISISSSPHIKKSFDLTVRLAGSVTNALNTLTKGAKVTIRGPYGHGWPKIKVDDEIVLIAGGIGLPAIKPLLDDYCSGYIHCKSMQLFYGTTDFEKLVCRRDHKTWSKEMKVQMTLDNRDPKWKGNVGLITKIIAKSKITSTSKVFIIGPPVMYKFVLEELKKKGIKDDQIFLSLERRMSCGFGTCQHCAVGPYYTCKDGPVFRYDKIKKIPQSI